MVLAALVTACRLAICPTRRSPLSVKPTTVGVVRPPSLLGTICTAPPSSTATQQLVVPKSIPTTLPITFLSLSRWGGQAVSRYGSKRLRLVDGKRRSVSAGGSGRPHCGL